jgi:alanyl-tRNA synthetase
LIDILNREEASFARTLIRGEGLFAKYAADAEASGSATLDGQHVWRLYDTYGFPVDLTELMAEERGLKVDRVALEEARAESLQASKAGGKGKAGASVRLDVHDLEALEKNPEVHKTNDSAKYGESA